MDQGDNLGKERGRRRKKKTMSSRDESKASKDFRKSEFLSGVLSRRPTPPTRLERKNASLVSRPIHSRLVCPESISAAVRLESKGMILKQQLANSPFYGAWQQSQLKVYWDQDEDSKHVIFFSSVGAFFPAVHSLSLSRCHDLWFVPLPWPLFKSDKTHFFRLLKK